MGKINMDKKLVYDVQEFYMLIGGCNELAERDFENFEIMDEVYKESMNNLMEKYGVTLDEGMDFPDNYLNAENRLDYKFTEMMMEVGN